MTTVKLVRKTLRMAKSLFLLSLAWATFLLGGCAKEESQPAADKGSSPVATRPAIPTSLPRTITMKIGSDTFNLEVAANEHDRAQGLMYRQSMPLDHGMIFVFSNEQERVFWMRNTLIPLDIIYVNAGGRVVSIKQGVPLQEEPTIPSEAPMKWAIELNEGVAGATGLTVGNKLNIPAGARQADEN
jgi:uncharacterized membrane protein (UPF0127 family)